MQTLTSAVLKFLISVLALVGILFLSTISFFRRMSGEARVTKKLKSLCQKNKQCSLFNNVILETPDGTTQIDHILISPYGVFVIETKNYKGWIFGDKDQKHWTQSLFGSHRSSVKHQFQNPIHQNYKHVKAIEHFLGIDPKFIFNIVVFAGRSKFKTEMPENVKDINNLIPYIESHVEIFFDAEKTKELAQKLGRHIEHTSLNEETHLKNLAQNKEHPICPKCGKSMVRRVAHKGSGAGSEFWGCPNYPSCRITKKMA